MSLAVITALNTVVAMLGDQAAGRFTVIGYQRQKKPAVTRIDDVLVQLWIESADIDWSRSSRNGPKEHEARIKVQFTVAQPASGDVATLLNPASSDAQRAAALAGITAADINTSTAVAAAWSAVFEILDDARNDTFGLPKGAISDKSFSNFRQDTLPSQGGLAINTATASLEFRVKETQLGDSGTTPDPAIYDITLQGAGIVEDVGQQIEMYAGSPTGYAGFTSDGINIESVAGFFSEVVSRVDDVSQAGVIIQQ